MSSKQNDISVGIIDDQVLFAEGLAELLNTIPRIGEVVVYKAPDSNSFTIPYQLHDVILLDINMPIKNGYEICSEIRKKDSHKKIIFLSVREDQSTINKVKELGANGYIFKNSRRDELKNVIENVIDGKDFFMEKALNFKDVYSFSDGKKIKITYRELEFLRYLVQQLTTKEIAVKMHISEYTVVSYRKSLFQKFEVKNMLGLAKYAYEIL